MHEYSGKNQVCLTKAAKKETMEETERVREVEEGLN